MEDFNTEAMLYEFILCLNQFVFREESTTENIFLIFPHPFFIKNIIIFDVSNDVNVRFAGRVLLMHRVF